MPMVAVVVVTFSSDRVLPACLSALESQSRRPDTVVIVDNDSPDASYLENLQSCIPLRVIRNPRNEGFCRANNIGFESVRNHKYVVFLNPDAFPHPDLIEGSILWMEQRENSGAAIATGTLLGFDITLRRPTGLLDSTGIFQSWYGKWYDRGQGHPWNPASSSKEPESIPAVCGALMVCRTTALEGALLNGSEVFDERFFMYKEDIDLSLRLRRQRWKLVYLPNLICHHCRGWQGRRRMSALARYLSARNELRVCIRNRGVGIVFSLAKLVFVGIESACIGLIRGKASLRSP